MATRSKAWVCGSLLAGIAGFESRRGHGGLSVVIIVCCQVEASASGSSLGQRSPTDCGVSHYDRETSIKRFLYNQLVALFHYVFNTLKL